MISFLTKDKNKLFASTVPGDILALILDSITALG